MSSIQIKIPPGNWINEKTYAARCVLSEFLGLAIGSISIGQASTWEIACDGNKLVFPNLFFPEDNPEKYLAAEHLPAEPYHWVDYAALGITQGRDANSDLPFFWCNKPVSGIEDVDIFGTIFFFLSRYEECVSGVRDSVNRFTADASIAGKVEIIHRPLVDEYVELLRRALKEKFPGIALDQPDYRLLLSHDVDIPHSWLGARRYKLVRALARNLIRDRSIRKAVDTAASYFDPQRDPVFCYDWIMSLAEKYGQRTSFYFLVNATDPYDISYDLGAPPMRELLQDIAARGHDIGLHGSFNSYADARMLLAEKQKLEFYVGKQVSGGRQHYLRFEVPTTWRAWDEAGFAFDSTLGFADRAGFRCGTAREYPVFDLQTSRVLNLRERPLICMEHTLLDPDYQGLNMEQSYEYATNLIDQVRRYGGNFTLLWHNHNLTTDAQRELFAQMVKYAA